jgi:hypothetical protein
VTEHARRRLPRVASTTTIDSSPPHTDGPTRLNSTLDVPIEELNAQISALHVENLRLYASEIALSSQRRGKSRSASRSAFPSFPIPIIHRTMLRSCNPVPITLLAILFPTSARILLRSPLALLPHSLSQPLIYILDRHPRSLQVLPPHFPDGYRNCYRDALYMTKSPRFHYRFTIYPL